MFKDKLNNWYEILNKNGTGNKQKIDKNFKKHLIMPNSMIMMIGSTGAGKTQALCDFLSRKNEAFHRIIIFSGSTTDEPLYNFLTEKIDGIELIDDPDELPELNETYDDEDIKDNQEKLIVFDDMINLPKKYLIKIQKWFNSARKKGWTCISMIQNYTDAPIQMRRNAQYFIIFKLNDTNTITQILKNHNNNGDDKELVKKAYFEATKEPNNFFMLDLKNSDYRYRHNFTDIINI
jgi:hypothetical protein